MNGPTDMCKGDAWKYQYCLAACARWEDEDIVEWIEYHRYIGIEHIYLYCNDNDSLPLLKRVLPYMTGPEPFLTFVHWTSIGAQVGMYLDYLKNYKSESKWCCFLDIDEFVVLKKHNKIGDFLTSFHDVHCVYFNWILYGNNGKKDRDGKFVLNSLTRRCPQIDLHTKNFFLTDHVTWQGTKEAIENGRMAFAHFWNGYHPAGTFTIVNTIGEDMSTYIDDFPQNASKIVADPARVEAIRETAYIAHFQFKSEGDFLRRVERGGFVQQNVWKDFYESGQVEGFLQFLNKIEDFSLKEKFDEMTAGLVRTGPRD